jgi:hypothetical protein
MTADGVVSELPTGTVLALCDKLLGEVGRRSHRFAWLRTPGDVADAWLPVDGYYPRHRLVVICHPDHTPHDDLFAKLVPRHGLRLLQFTPDELGSDSSRAEDVLRRMIARLPPALGLEAAEDARPRSARRKLRDDGSTNVGAAGRASARAAESADASAADQPVQRPRPGRLAPLSLPATDGVAGQAEIVAAGVVAGAALVAACGAELIWAVISVMLDSGRVVLGLGIAFDACARVLGTLDSERAGRTQWAWACAVIGSPAVVAAARVWPRMGRPGGASAPGEQPIEAAPFAGLMATLALVCIFIGLIS